MLSQRKVMSMGSQCSWGLGGWMCAVWSLTAPLLCVFIKVSCDKMNVINIFADHKRGNNTEIFCKAATIARETKSCHRELGGIYYNLLSLGKARHKVRHSSPCTAHSTTTNKWFLSETKNFFLSEHSQRGTQHTQEHSTT
uniref:Uncharacterized protein n=1 Tax=Zonotrichia albicollis TaxID=44394 RepID=A0A8D2MQP5_ZONAL